MSIAPPTIAFVLPSFAGGGAERVLLTLMAGLDRDRFAPALVVLDPRGPLANLVPTDVPVSHTTAPRLGRALPSLVAALRRLAPRAVVSSLIHVNLALLAARPFLPRRTRIVLREANLPSLSLPAARLGRTLRFGMHRLYRRADVVIASSSRMADELTREACVPPARLVTMPNPVDLPALRHAASTVHRTPGPGPRFVAAGRLTRQKGFDRLIAAFATLPDEARLTILGEGPERSSLQSALSQAGMTDRVALPGFDPAPWALFAGADAFLMPSRWEGMPNAALEALSCGTPVIATTESGGLAEVAAATTPGAVTLVAGAPDDFARALGAVTPAPPGNGPRRSLLPAAFEAKAVAARFAEILERVIA